VRRVRRPQEKADNLALLYNLGEHVEQVRVRVRVRVRVKVRVRVLYILGEHVEQIEGGGLGDAVLKEGNGDEPIGRPCEQAPDGDEHAEGGGAIFKVDDDDRCERSDEGDEPEPQAGAARAVARDRVQRGGDA
jgi:hypothetical protein